MSIISPELKFGEVISRRSAYGLIWEGTIDHNPCVIKMVMLSSGLHYDKDKDLYRDGKGQKCKYHKQFDRNDHAPYYHQDFQKRRAMKPADFDYEARSLINLSRLGLAPKVYSYGVSNELYAIHYGFIVMEKLDCSVKDILLKRDLKPEEMDIIKATIDKMHMEQGITHGDMKPSNLGVNLNSRGRVHKCLVFDCQKIKNHDTIDSSDHKRQVRKDWEVFKRHVKWNRKGGP